MHSKKIILTFILFLLMACSSLKEKAKENYEKGNYEEAYELYKKAYNKDKKDAEVKTGLKKAVKSLLNQKIVNLRDIKNKKSADYVLTKIAEIEKLQRENKEYLDYNSQQFYGKELKKTRSIILSKWNRDLTKKNALKFFIQQDHYDFLNLNKDQEGKAVLRKIKKLGLADCLDKIKSNERDYYTNSFITKYCAVFGKKVRFKKKTPTGLVTKISLLSEVEMDTQTKADFIKALESELQRKLKFVSSEGQGVLKVGISGSYRYRQSQEKESAVHEYYVSEPYETVEQYNEEETKEVTDCTRLKPDGTCGTKFITENVTKSRPAVRYRQSKRYFPYKYIIRQSSLDLDLSFGVLGEQFRLKRNYISKAKQHDYDLPEMKLKPVNEKFLTELDHRNTIFAKDVGSLVNSFHASWQKKYCNLNSNETFFTEGSKAILCKKVLKTNAYDKWLSKYYELNMQDPIIKKFVQLKLL